MFFILDIKTKIKQAEDVLINEPRLALSTTTTYDTAIQTIKKRDSRNEILNLNCFNSIAKPTTIPKPTIPPNIFGLTHPERSISAEYANKK